MPQIEVLRSDPGRDARIAEGARVLVIRNLQRTPDFQAGVEVGGIVGTPTNDRGVPNVPVVLGSVQDLFSKWGGFSPYVGDYTTTPKTSGYNGNAAALLWRLKVRRPVFVPVDMALKASSSYVKARLVRGALPFTVTVSDDVVACPGHQFAVGDTLQLISLVGATGANVDTTYEVIGPVVPGVSFKLKVPGGAPVDFQGANGSGVLRPVSIASPSFAAAVAPAGTRIRTPSGSTVLRLVEDVVWGAGEYEPREVRVAKVSGVETAPINTVSQIVDTLQDPTIALHTVAATAPDAFGAPQIVARYQEALAALNANAAGKSVTAVITDRTEAAINDALLAHCAEASSAGVLRRGYFSPPIGTTIEQAIGETGNGIKRPTLDAAYGAAAYPWFRRRFDLDAGRLDAIDDYKAPFPAHVLLWAKVLATVPEENPAYVDAEPGLSYGAAEVGLQLSPGDQVTLYRAGYCVSLLEPHEGRYVAAWRDGIMADGTKIARARLTDLVTRLVIERAVPWHKRLATEANQDALVDAVESALEALKSPPGASRGQGRIHDYAVSAVWDGEAEEMQVIVQVLEVGNMDVITIPLTIGASGVSIRGGGTEG